MVVHLHGLKYSQGCRVDLADRIGLVIHHIQVFAIIGDYHATGLAAGSDFFNNTPGLGIDLDDRIFSVESCIKVFVVRR